MIKNDFKCWLHDLNSEDCCQLGKDASIDINGCPACQTNCVNFSRIYAMLKSADIPDIFWNTKDTTLRATNQDLTSFRTLKTIEEDIVDFVNSGTNLYIYSSNFSNGKTSWATRLGKNLIKHISFTCCDENLIRYVYFPDYVFRHNVNMHYSFENKNRVDFLDYTKSLSKVKLVIWDNYGYDSGTLGENVILNSIIQTRLNSKLSNIFVSYKNPEDISNAIYNKDDLRSNNLKRCDMRVIDSSICVKLFGESQRNRKALSFRTLIE